MPYDPDADYVIRKCSWNPTPGKLYQNFDSFYVNNQPTLTYEFRSLARKNCGDARCLINHGEIFMYIGGMGGRQSVPGHYTAFRILHGEQIRWLIYPERWHRLYDSAPIDPIRL